MKKMLSLVMMLCMLLPACAMAEGYQYVEYCWNNDEKALTKTTGDVPDYEPVTSSTDGFFSPKDESSWYVVDGNVTFDSRISVGGTVNLVLAPGSKLTAIKGISVEGSSRLNIYGTPDGAGTLIAKGEGDDAGIGEGDTHGGNVWIHGGTVNATGGADGGAGIGGYRSAVVISGGTVTAMGGAGGAGIGCGQSGQSCHVEILGGTVTARRGESDGSNDADDIGRGANGGTSSRIVITGGNVDAVYVDGPKNSEETGLQHRIIQLAGAGAGAAVSALCEIPSWYEDKTIKYGFNDVVTFADGMLHLWLPSSTDVQDVKCGGYEYGPSTTSSEYVQVFKRYPAAVHFAVTLPQNAVYNGSAHEATVTPAAGVTGMGAITVYYAKAGETGWVDGAPVDAGKYQVYITLTEGESWLGTQQGATLTNGNWTFEITAPTGGSEPGSGEPGGGEPGSGEPGSGESSGSEPGSGEPGGGEPGGSEPGSGESSGGESGGGEPGGSEPGGSEPSGGEPGSSGTAQPDGYQLFDLLDDQKIPVCDSGWKDQVSRKLLSRLNWLTYAPDGLRHTDFNTVDKIADELVKQTKAAGFAADADILLEAELGYQRETGWQAASYDEQARVKRVRMRTELSGKVDLMNCDFLITHMFAHGERAGEVEIIRDYQIRRLDKPGAYELSFEMNGMSPVLISMKVKAPADAAANLPKTGDPSMLGAWAALLAVSAAGLKMRRKK